MLLFVISGLSGAGKSVALHAIEDQGGYCIDNLPIELLPAFSSEALPILQGKFQLIGLSIDVRNHSEKLHQLPELLHKEFHHTPDVECQLIFIEADIETIIRRFGESRRPHPLSRENPTLESSIHQEIEQLAPIASSADFRLDSSQTNIYQLRKQIQWITEQKHNLLFLKLQSFGFKHGAPKDADFIFDARCLPNPHWEPELRHMTGQDTKVAHFLEQTEETGQMIEDISLYLQRWIPHFLSTDRAYLTIAIGCTGGRHRSVYMIEKVMEELQKLQDNADEDSENSWILHCALNIHHRQLKEVTPQ